MHETAYKLGKELATELCSCNKDAMSLDKIEKAKAWSEIAKNLACAEKDYLIVKAMKDEEEERKIEDELEKAMGGRIGYRSRGSDGRYMRRNYNPYLYMNDDEWIDEYMNNPNFENNARMGYRSMNSNMGHINNDARYGRPYNEYQEHKKHYTDTKSPEHKEKMKQSRLEVMDSIRSMIRNMSEDMDMNEKADFKNDIVSLGNSVK